MKNYVVAVMLLAATSLGAQEPKVSWSEESKKELEYGSLVQGSGVEMIKLCFEPHGGLFSKKTVTPILSRYDHTLNEKEVKNVIVEEEGIRFDNLLSVKNNLYLFTNRYDR